MFTRTNLRPITVSLSLVAIAIAGGCEQGPIDEEEEVGIAQDEIVDVMHTPVERQSIGNCWLYAEATWVESIHLAAQQGGSSGGGTTDTCAHKVCAEGAKLVSSCSPCAKAICDADPYCCNNEWDNVCTAAVAEKCGANACTDAPGGGTTTVTELDVSQSYWTYWHWFDQVTDGYISKEIETGGGTYKSHAIIRDRGLMNEKDFVPEDSTGEMSNRQSAALSAINSALTTGELKTQEARRDGKKVRKVFDTAWGLTADVKKQLDKAFGEDGEKSLRSGGRVDGTKIIDPSTVKVRYTKLNGTTSEVKNVTLVQALTDWQTVSYPYSAADRRKFLQRVQRALHDRQPVVITWDVDFNAMENGQNERRGSFNMTTLGAAGGPGRQGGHMTVLEDYAAETTQYGFLEAGKTLDPKNATDAKKLKALLETGTKIKLLRVKNSWGGDRPDRAFAPGFPGYHDLYLDYLNGPIKFCPDQTSPTNENCTGESTPLDSVMLPPGY